MDIKTTATHQPEPITVWSVWTNTDLTEGRGFEVCLGFYQLKASAINASKGKGVQGSDAHIKATELIWHNSRWCGPVRIIEPTREEKNQNVLLEMKAAALKKAKDAGLTDDEITLLKNQ